MTQLFGRSWSVDAATGEVASSDPGVGPVKVQGRFAMVTLTAREHETLKLMAEGHSNAVIGVKLGVSAHTAKFHVANVMRKMDVDNRAQAAVAAVRMGLV
jgi:DNA-binding CsgD family transcriptional regulator